MQSTNQNIYARNNTSYVDAPTLHQPARGMPQQIYYIFVTDINLMVVNRQRMKAPLSRLFSPLPYPYPLQFRTQNNPQITTPQPSKQKKPAGRTGRPSLVTPAD